MTLGAQPVPSPSPNDISYEVFGLPLVIGLRVELKVKYPPQFLSFYNQPHFSIPFSYPRERTPVTVILNSTRVRGLRGVARSIQGRITEIEIERTVQRAEWSECIGV